MNNAVITFTFAGLPQGYCYTSPERFALDIAAGLQGYLPGTYSTIVRSETEPVATDRDKVWVQVNADGAPTGRVFTYAYGKWVALNLRRDPAERVWFEGSESDAWSYDGGDGTDPTSNPPTATTGAMWEYDKNYAFRFPLMAGTSPKPTTVSIGDTGGAEEIVQTAAQVGKHTHPVWPADGGDGNTGRLWSHFDPNGEGPDSRITQPLTPSIASPYNTSAHTGVTALEQTDGDALMNVMPPYRVGAWLKPTARQYYTP